jgi:hypothetical protein
MSHRLLLLHVKGVEDFIKKNVYYKTGKMSYLDMLFILENIGKKISKFLILEENFRKINDNDARISKCLQFEPSLKKTLLTQKYLICGTNQVLIQLYMKKIDTQYIGYVVCVRCVENVYADFLNILSYDEFDEYDNSDEDE